MRLDASLLLVKSRARGPITAVRSCTSDGAGNLSGPIRFQPVSPYFMASLHFSLRDFQIGSLDLRSSFPTGIWGTHCLPPAGRRPSRATRPAHQPSPAAHAAAFSRQRHQLYPRGRHMPPTATAVAPSQPPPLNVSNTPSAPTNGIDNTGASASSRATAPTGCRRSDAATCRRASAKGAPTARDSVAAVRLVAVAAVVAAYRGVAVAAAACEVPTA